MKLYGLRKNFYERGCCPGHDLFPREKYNNRRSIRAHRRDTKLCHRLGRHRLAYEVRLLIKSYGFIAPEEEVS